MSASGIRIRWHSVAFIAIGLVAGLFALFCPLAVANEGEVEPLAGGENQRQARLYFILDDSAAARLGHAAIIIFDGTTYFYYSYGPTDKYGPTGLITATFSDWASALAYAKSGDPVNKYTYEEHWNVTPTKARIAKNVAAAYAGTTYHFTTHNCWNMVFDAIRSAVGDSRIINWGSTPGYNYDKNKWLADGNSKL